MKVLECRGADSRVISEAADALREGNIIIYPTDTMYALGCDALNARAVERLCRLKGLNPEKNLLSIVCADISGAAEYARIDNRAFAVLKHYLPGPFTFILPAATKLPKVLRGRKTIGVRIPANEFARGLAEALGNPLMSATAGSYDDSEEVDGRIVAEEYAGNKEVSLAVDSGFVACSQSTIVDLTESSTPELVRQGVGIFDY